MATRRAFLASAAGTLSAVSLPSLACFSSLVDRRDSRRLLCFEQGLGAGRFGEEHSRDAIERRGLDLDAAPSWMPLDGIELLDAGYAAVAAIGSAPAVFAIRTLLGGGWRVIASGSHGAGAPGVHRLEVFEGIAPDVATLIRTSTTPRGYIDALLRFDAAERGDHRVQLALDVPSWGAVGTASFLAWPARSA